MVDILLAVASSTCLLAVGEAFNIESLKARNKSIRFEVQNLYWPVSLAQRGDVFFRRKL